MEKNSVMRWDEKTGLFINLYRMIIEKLSHALSSNKLKANVGKSFEIEYGV